MAKKHKALKDLSGNDAVLIAGIDSIALGILKEISEPVAGSPPLPLPTKLDLLDKLARWVAVRNKVVATPEQSDEVEGRHLDGIRRQLKARNALGRKTPGILGDRPGDFVNTTYARRPVDKPRRGDGADLADLRARLPRADDGDHVGDRDDDGGEDDPVSGDGGGVRSDLSSDPPGHDNGPRGERDV